MSRNTTGEESSPLQYSAVRVNIAALFVFLFLFLVALDFVCNEFSGPLLSYSAV